MRTTKQNILLALFLLALGIGASTMLTPTPRLIGAAADEKPSATPRYTVVETEGTNLVVTDNSTNMLYFYTIDKEEKPGADLKLRGSVDLTQVGKPVIKPKLHHVEKK